MKAPHLSDGRRPFVGLGSFATVQDRGFTIRLTDPAPASPGFYRVLAE